MAATQAAPRSVSDFERTLQPADRAMLEVCRAHPNVPQTPTTKGATTEVLARGANMTKEQALESLNHLLESAFITMFQQGPTLTFRVTREVDVARIQAMTEEEHMVFELIRQGGNRGTWTRDIRTRSSLQQSQVLKILKTLESRKLIKAVKSVESKNKKLYMLAEIEPSRQITGGVWYSEQEFDSEYISILLKTCHAFIRDPMRQGASGTNTPIHMVPPVTVEDVAKHIEQTEISTIKLNEEDIRTILNTLVLDGKIALIAPNMYRPSADIEDTILPARHTGITEMPCSVCPVFHFCSADGPINPSNCEYFTEWLKDTPPPS